VHPEGANGRTAVALLTERRYLGQRQPRGLASELRRRGCNVAIVEPDAGVVTLTDDTWLGQIDACVARGRSEAVLACLLAAERHGIPTVNRHAAIAAVHDKAAMAASLAAAGIPTPRTSLGSPARLAAALPAAAYPVIVKPVRGDNGRGLRLCRAADDLAGLDGIVAGPVLAQPFLAGDGADLKLYGLGERIWAVRKPSPFRADGLPERPRGRPAGPTPIELSAGLRELAVRCAELFGLELFGVDCLLTAAGPVVIEVNEYPNYSGIAEANIELADHVLARISAEVAR
jgi:ribosomal protein S6--L-glutamate ligase